MGVVGGSKGIGVEPSAIVGAPIDVAVGAQPKCSKADG